MRLDQNEGDPWDSMDENEDFSGILVGEHEGTVVFLIRGKGTQLNSHLLKQYLLECLEQNKTLFQIDLTSCTYMDSTFLGTLAGLSSKVRARASTLIQILNPTDRIMVMLENLGIESLFQITRQTVQPGNMLELEAGQVSKEAKSQEMLEAHEKLSEISPANAAKFRDIVTLLRKRGNRP